MEMIWYDKKEWEIMSWNVVLYNKGMEYVQISLNMAKYSPDGILFTQGSLRGIFYGTLFTQGALRGIFYGTLFTQGALRGIFRGILFTQGGLRGIFRGVQTKQDGVA